MTSDIKIVTFNLRCVWNGIDNENSFVHRAGLIWEKIKEEKPEVIAFQEGISKNIAILKDMLGEYLFLGHGRGKDYAGEGVYTAIKISDFDLLGYETFWLSPTPYIAGSRFEDQSEFPRTCVVSVIRHKETGKIFRIYNVHLDHIRESARLNGAKCVMEMIFKDIQKTDACTVLLGDFNETPEGKTIEFISQNLYDVTKESGITFHDFHRIDGVKIDYIFVSEKLKDSLDEMVVWKDECNNISLSDHYPICAKFKL